MRYNTDKFSMRDEKFYLVVKRYGHAESTKKHSHDFIEMVFVDSGFSMHRVGGRTSLLLPGDLFYVIPGVSHEYWKSLNNCVYNCMFYPDILGEDIQQLKKLPVLDEILSGNSRPGWDKTRLKHEDRYEVLGLLKKLEAETCQKPTGWMVRAKALLIDLLVCVSRGWVYNSIATGGYAADIPNVNSRVLKILELSANTRMNVKDMARDLGYSPEYFSRIFKRLTGISPSTFLVSMKISKAAEKLADLHLSISDISEACGYDDVSYFCRLFKKETGKTPSEFRNTIISERYSRQPLI